MYIKNKIISGSKYLAAILSVLIIASCEEDDVFTGAPSGPVTVLRGSITTPETDVVASQSFPVTVSLGDNPETAEADLLTFPVDVSVEAITIIPNSNKRTRKSFVIPAGQNSLVSTMNAPSGDATSDLPFNLSVKMYLSAITSVPEAEELRGFEGKQYTIVSDTVDLGYGDTPINAINAKKLGVRFHFQGPYSGQATNFNDLNIVLKKNGSVMPSQSSIQGVSPLASTTRPIYGTLSSAAEFEQVNFYDIAQELKISNEVSGVYKVKAPNTNGVATDKPHGFKVGDEVQIANVNKSNSAPVVVQIASVADAYNFTFNYAGPSLFNEPAFYQPKFVASVDAAGQPKEWNAFVAYSGNQTVVINGVVNYAIKRVFANPLGNLPPALDTDHWTTVMPVINWDTVAVADWVAGTIYHVNSVVKVGSVVYVAKADPPVTGGVETAGPSPVTDTTRWTPKIAEYTADVSNYTSVDTYTMEVYAKNLAATPLNVPYRISVRFPDEISKIYSGVFTNLTVGTAATAIPKLQIVKTTTQGVSTYVVSPL